MANYGQNKKDELADWDPSAPSKKPEADLDDDDEISAKRRRMGAIILGVAVLVLALIWARGLFTGSAGPALVTTAVASSEVNLQGPQVTLVGSVEGPRTLVGAPTPTTVLLAAGAGQPETFRLAGLIDGDYLAPTEFAAMSAQQRKERQDRLAESARQRVKAIKKICEGKQIWLLRLSPAQPGQPSAAYLFLPDAPPGPGEQPKGKATLINAALLRSGDAAMALEPQPFYDPPMLDCQLAAVIEARDGAAPTSIWARDGIEMPRSADLEARMARLEAELK